MPAAMKKRALKDYVNPVLMYKYEAWTITTPIQKEIEAKEIWFWRRM